MTRLCRDISTAPVVIAAPTGGITAYYDWYHDSFGRKKLVRNDGNFAISTATASPGVFHFEMGRMAFAVLRGTHTKPLAYLGGGPRAKVETEGTWQWGVENAHGSVSQINN